MPLDPKVRKLLDSMKRMNMPAMSAIPIEEVRRNLDIMTRMNPIPPGKVGSVLDRSIPGPEGDLSIRVYSPKGEGAFPVLVYFHGGGFIMGNLDSHDLVCRDLCRGADIMVVAVNYRLAPENKFPAAADDCLAAIRWVAAHVSEMGGDPRLIAVGGDSAGGNLATVSTLRIREEGGPDLCGQLLVYPTTVNHCFDLPSHIENGSKRYYITLKDMKYIQGLYLQDASHAEDPWASPLYEPFLGNLPPAFVVTAQYDPLRDEGGSYAKRLKEAGVIVKHICYDGMIHGFWKMSGLPQARQSMDEACEWLNQVFASRLKRVG